jgi:hypothetical protein
MDDTGTDAYASTLSLPSGSSLSTNNHIQQAGTLNLNGGTLSANTNFWGNGSITVTASSTLSAGGNVVLQGPSTPGPNTTVGSNFTLTVSANTFDVNTSLSVLSGGTLSFSGALFKTQATSSVALDSGSTLTLAGAPTLTTNVKGLVTTNSSTISTAGTFILDAGTFILDAGTFILDAGTLNFGAGGTDTVVGDLATINSGTLNLGDALTIGSALTMTTGSLTVGAAGPSLPGSGGTAHDGGRHRRPDDQRRCQHECRDHHHRSPHRCSQRGQSELPEQRRNSDRRYHQRR